MGSNDAEDRGQSQARAFPNGFGGKERFKDPADNLRIHSSAGVGERQTDKVAIALLGVHRGRRAVNGFEGCGNGKTSAVGHGIARVNRQVHRNLVQHAPIRIDGRDG